MQSLKYPKLIEKHLIFLAFPNVNNYEIPITLNDLTNIYPNKKISVKAPNGTINGTIKISDNNYYLVVISAINGTEYTQNSVGYYYESANIEKDDEIPAFGNLVYKLTNEQTEDIILNGIVEKRGTPGLLSGKNLRKINNSISPILFGEIDFDASGSSNFTNLGNLKLSEAKNHIFEITSKEFHCKIQIIFNDVINFSINVLEFSHLQLLENISLCLYITKFTNSNINYLGLQCFLDKSEIITPEFSNFNGTTGFENLKFYHYLKNTTDIVNGTLSYTSITTISHKDEFNNYTPVFKLNNNVQKIWYEKIFSNIPEIKLFVEKDLTQIQIDISNNLLIPGTLYKITGCCKNNLYDDGMGFGTTLYLTALTNNKLSSNGYGEFHNPIYDKTLSGYNIFDTSTNYSRNNLTIWGGYFWQNLGNGNGSIINSLELDGYWEKIDYGDSSCYNKVIDEIEYDIQNDWLLMRYEKIGNNKVNFNFDDFYYYKNTLFLLNYNSIVYFQFGNPYNYNIDNGIGNQNIQNALNCNINFNGISQLNLEFKAGSYQINNTISNSFRQRNIIFENDSFQYNVQFLNNIKQENILFQQNSGISNISNINDKMNYFIFEQNCKIDDIDLNTSTILSSPNSKTVYRRPDGIIKTRFYNNSDVLVITNFE